MISRFTNVLSLMFHRCGQPETNSNITQIDIPTETLSKAVLKKQSDGTLRFKRTSEEQAERIITEKEKSKSTWRKVYSFALMALAGVSSVYHAKEAFPNVYDNNPSVLNVQKSFSLSTYIPNLGYPAQFLGGAVTVYAMRAMHCKPMGSPLLFSGMLALVTGAQAQNICPTFAGSYDTPGRRANSVALSGNYAYVADHDTGGLQIINISNPANPTFIGSYDTPGYAEGVAVSGNYAYVADWSTGGLQIINIANPANPTFVGKYNTPGNAHDVALSGNYAFVADSGTLQIVNISNPANPTFVGSYGIPGIASGVVLSGNYAYLAGGRDGGLQIINIANPANPTFVGSYITPGWAMGVALSGNYAYVADRNTGGLQIINISNPANPSFVGNYNTPGYANGVAVSGNYAFVADGSGLHIINIANPANPSFVGNYNTPGNAHGVALSGNYAYVADGSSGLQIIKLDCPTSNSISSSSITGSQAELICPSFVGSYNMLVTANGVAVSGNYAFVADGRNRGLQIINISNPANPSFVGGYNTPGAANGVVVSGNYAFVVDGIGGLHIINIANPANPTFVGSYTGAANGVAVSGNYAFVVDGIGLHIINIANPANPYFVGSYITPGLAQSVALLGNYAFVADYFNGLQIINITNPANSTFVGSYDTPGTAHDVAVSGNYAYVADDIIGGLQIINISNPSNLTFVGSYDTPGTAYGVAVSGNYAFVADGGFGLQIINIADLANPSFVGNFNTQKITIGVTLSGNYAYVADDTFGFQIIKLDCPISSSRTITTSASGSLGSYSSSSNSLTQQSSSTSSMSSQPSASFSSSISSSFSKIPLSTNNSSIIWISLGVGIAGIACLGLTGTTAFYVLKKRKRSADSETHEDDNIATHRANIHSRFELEPIKQRAHPEIGEKYYQLSTVFREEAQEIYEQTGHVIVLPEGKKKFKYVIGKGHFGAIKVAQRIDDGQYVASKKVKGEENMRVSEAEANMQRDAAGDNVLPIYNTIQLERVLYHFMPLAGYGDGCNIQVQLAALHNPKLALEILKFIAKDILTGLQTIHAKGIYHLDIKPDNVVFTKDGTGYITDFGCAKKVKETQISHNAIGDNRYFSPERLQACKEQNTFDAEKTDVWAAGMMLFQMIKNLSPLEVFEMPDSFHRRAQVCDQAYFYEKLKRFEELQDPDDWDIWWVIKGLLNPNPKARFTATRALEAPCFKGLNKTTQTHIFEDMRAEKFIQATGKKREEIDLGNYQNAVAAFDDEEKKVYYSEEYQQHYKVVACIYYKSI